MNHFEKCKDCKYLLRNVRNQCNGVGTICLAGKNFNKKSCNQKKLKKITKLHFLVYATPSAYEPTKLKFETFINVNDMNNPKYQLVSKSIEKINKYLYS